MKRVIIILSIILIAIVLGHNIINNKNNEILEKKEDEMIIIEDGEEKTISPISGIHSSIDKVDRRPVAIMFDNHPNARWQAGLSQAEIVYEFFVEHPYTRYMGIYLVNDPEEIGPIRSSRPYFVTTLLQYDPVYVRAGGSDEAKEYIKELNISDIDAITNSQNTFFRNDKVGKKSPHNLYTSMESIRRTQLEKGYNTEAIYDGFKFYEEDTKMKGQDAVQVNIKYNEENSTSYIYNEKDKVYERYKDGEAHIDEYYNIPIVAKNIIIQEVDTKSIDDEGRLEIDLIGSGKGLYISNGKTKEISWTKESKHEKTIYYDENLKEIKLNPGVTWIQITNKKSDITIK